MNKCLITLTGYTCSGKSYLLNKMNETEFFKKIPSFTTRPPRSGEIKDVDYFFIDEHQFKIIQGNEGFVELFKYGQYFYGMSQKYFNTVLNESKIPVIICTPEGVQTYETYCKNNQIDMIKVYVYLDEEERLLRLLNRMFKGIQNDVSDENVRLAIADEKIKLTLFENIKRCRNTYVVEQNWFGMNKWDVIVPGNNVDDAISLINKKLTQIKENVL